MDNLNIKIGVSSCLLGENVRWDGNHKRDSFLADIFGQYVTWVPVCPEVEIGMGIPRETVHLVGQDKPRMLGTRTKTDWTARMLSYAEKKMNVLEKMGLSGFILKKGSPSCGLRNVLLRTEKGLPAGRGSGLFADRLLQRFPSLPIEDEGRLNSPVIRENFIVRVFAFQRLKVLFSGKWEIKNAVAFHAAHKYLILAHSPKHYTCLGQLVANARKNEKSAFSERYRCLLIEGLSFHATVKKNMNVLQHIHGYFKKLLSPEDRRDILEVIGDYGKGLIPLIVPITLIKHYVKKFNIEYLQNQIYLNPHPKELMLRNHV